MLCADLTRPGRGEGWSSGVGNDRLIHAITCAPNMEGSLAGRDEGEGECECEYEG